jgi:hypothetical protein
MCTRVKKGKHEFLAHHGLIGIIVSDVFRNLKHGVLWEEEFLKVGVEMSQRIQEKEEEEKVYKPKNERRHGSYSLPHNLQIREPHSSNSLHISFLRTPWYKEEMRKLKTKWIGIRMNPPLLLLLHQWLISIRKRKRKNGKR